MKRNQLCVLVGVVATLASCQTRPLDGEDVDSRLPPLFFAGYTDQPNQLVEIEIRDTVASQWVKFGEAQTSTTAETDSAGKDWFFWSANLRMPRTGRFWPSGGGGLGTVRSRAGSTILGTGTAAEWNCIAQAVANGSAYAPAYDGCSTGNADDAALLGDCDIVSSGGCFDAAVLGPTPNDWPKNVSQGGG